MISSPCKKCSKKDFPKDECAKNCQLLQSIQDMQVTSGQNFGPCGIDYTDEYSYNIPMSYTSRATSIWAM
jgi:hypothetical protein